MRFTRTVEISTVDPRTLQAGQWVSADGAIGRFAGVTAAGTVVVAWNRGLSFKAYRKFARNMSTIRKAELAAYRSF